MGEKKWLGDKTGQGFYKKIKGAGGKSEIQTLDLNTMEYKPSQKVKFATLELTKTIEQLRAALQGAGQWQRQSRRVLPQDVRRPLCLRQQPHPRNLRRAVQDRRCPAGRFRLGDGPVRNLGRPGRAARRRADAEPKASSPPPGCRRCWPPANDVLLQSSRNGQRKQYYDIETKSYQAIPGVENFIILDNLRATGKVLWKNAGASRSRPRRWHPERGVPLEDEHPGRRCDSGPDEGRGHGRSRTTAAWWSATTRPTSRPGPTWAWCTCTRWSRSTTRST